MAQRQLTVISPQRIRSDIGDDYWLREVSGGPARTRRRTDERAIDCFNVLCWQAGRCAVPKLVGFRIQQKDRRQSTAGQLFDELAESMKNDIERFTFGDHLKKPLLSAQ